MSFKKELLYPCNPTSARGASTKLSSSGSKIVYTNGRTVVIRDINQPLASVSYSGHVANATVARISPSGYYCASGDANGNVRVWDVAGEDQVLKNEIKVISGKLNDLAWDGESKRIMAVGDGRERFGHVFMMDTGSSAGEISGHSKVINAVSIRHQRPFRAVTASDDTSIVLYQGAPYKSDKLIKTHTRFVQDVKFAPSGELFASVGADSAVFLYDGTTGDVVTELKDAHQGSAMAVSWAPDSKQFVTSSADCTVKLWDVETRKTVNTWTVGSGVDHQQVGNTWVGDEQIASLSVGGDLNIFDRRAGDKPTKILYGAQKGITSSVLSKDQTFYAGTYDGRVLSYSASGEIKPVTGQSHTGQVVALATPGSGASDTIYSAGFDDCVKEITATESSFARQTLSTKSQPRGLAAGSSGTVFTALTDSVAIFENGTSKSVVPTKFSPTSISATANGIVAVGGEDHQVHLFKYEGGTLKEDGLLDGNKGPVTAVAFSPDGSKLVAGDSAGKIVLFDALKRESITGRWTFHSARILALAWTSDGNHVASASLDTHVYIWSVQKPLKNIALKNIGPGGVSAVEWVADGKVAAAGADGCVRVFAITFHV